MLSALAMTVDAKNAEPQIHLSCKTSIKELSEADLKVVCEMLRLEIELQFPERRIVATGESNTANAQGTVATLVVQALQSDHVKGELAWQNLETKENYSGPSLQVDGMDGAPLQRLIEGFARDVLRVSMPPWEK